MGWCRIFIQSRRRGRSWKDSLESKNEKTESSSSVSNQENDCSFFNFPPKEPHLKSSPIFSYFFNFPLEKSGFQVIFGFFPHLFCNTQFFKILSGCLLLKSKMKEKNEELFLEFHETSNNSFRFSQDFLVFYRLNDIYKFLKKKKSPRISGNKKTIG